ncbi:MAG: hypothetical protein JF615_00595 [Asticcacaulis sp.]|nr:hypothetical protein [Asticcacaulis sp.]
MKKAVAMAAAGVSALMLAACTPSVNVNVNLAPIYAKLDVNVTGGVRAQRRELLTV